MDETLPSQNLTPWHWHQLNRHSLDSSSINSMNSFSSLDSINLTSTPTVVNTSQFKCPYVAVPTDVTLYIDIVMLSVFSLVGSIGNGVVLFVYIVSDLSFLLLLLLLNLLCN